MHPTNRRLRAGLVVLVALLAVLAGSGQARAATVLGSGADLWYTPAQPADNAVRLTVHIADDTDGRVTRFARYRVDCRGRTATRTRVGCLDDRGAERVCPAAQ